MSESVYEMFEMGDLNWLCNGYSGDLTVRQYGDDECRLGDISYRLENAVEGRCMNKTSSQIGIEGFASVTCVDLNGSNGLRITTYADSECRQPSSEK